MPQPVAELEEPHPVLVGHDVAVFVEVGKIGHARAEPLVLAFSDMPRRRVVFESPKWRVKASCSSSVMFCPRNTSTAYSSMPASTADLLGAEWLAAIDPRNLSGKHRMERTDRTGIRLTS